MRKTFLAICFATVTLLAGFNTFGADEEVKEAGIFDVVLVVDASKVTADFTKESAKVAIRLMGDTHRLGIVVFGSEPKLVHSLERISTLEHRTRASTAFKSAALDATGSDLQSALKLSLDHLIEKGRKGAKKVVLLVSDGHLGDIADPPGQKEQIKTKILPDYLAKNVVLHAVALGDADFDLLQVCANMTGGKCLAAPSVGTMTDALETMVERLAPPKEIIVPKLVSGGAFVEQSKDADQDTAKNDALRGTSSMTFAVGAIAIVVLGLVAVVIFLLFQVLKHVRPSKPEERAEPSDKVAKEGGFAELRDVSNGLHNLLVDAGELSEHLNLDLEDFGVEGWKKQKALREKYGELARGVFLLIDHLEIGVDVSTQDLGWLRDKLERILEDEHIEEMTVNPGEDFDGRYHVHIGEESSDLPPGSVLQIKRKGYVQRAGSSKATPVVLRRAEVVVVRGKPAKKPSEKPSGGKE